MKKSSSTSTLAASIGIFAVVWTVAVIAYTMILRLPWLCWGGVTGTLIGVAVAEVYLLKFRKQSQDNLDAVLTVCFLLGLMALNSGFILLGQGGFHWILLSANVSVLGVYLIVLMWAVRSGGNQTQRLQTAGSSTEAANQVSAKLAQLLAGSKDEQITEKLLDLNAYVHYSSNVSTPVTASYEAQMLTLLEEVATLIRTHADRRVVLQKIDDAKVQWKTRSGINH